MDIGVTYIYYINDNLMAEFADVFENTGVSTLMLLPSVPIDVSRYKTEFSDAMQGGIILDSVSLTDFLARQQFAPGADLPTVLQELYLLNECDFMVEGKKDFVASAPFVVHKQAVIHEIARPIISALCIMQQYGTIDLQNMGYRSKEKMMLISVGGHMVGDVVTYKDKKYIIAAINPYEKHNDSIFECGKPILLIDKNSQKAIAVCSHEIN